MQPRIDLPRDTVMRKITATQISVFLALLAVIIALSVFTAGLLAVLLPAGDLRGVVIFLVFVCLALVYGIVFYRIFLHFFPLLPGYIGENSRQEFIYHVYILFYLILFYPVMRSGFVPAPIMRAVYLGLGARLGDNTFSMGLILDPGFVEMGDNGVVGQGAILIPHVIEGSRLAHFPITMGHGVTIGAHACVLSGTKIGDGAVVATGAVVSKGTEIGPREVWGGVPARKIGDVDG